MPNVSYVCLWIVHSWLSLRFSLTFIYMSCFPLCHIFNTTFNNIPVISWQSVLLVEETGVPEENHRPVTSHWQFYHIMFYRVHLANWNIVESGVKHHRYNPNLYVMCSFMSWSESYVVVGLVSSITFMW
jgi:hypothetical protein